MRYTRYARPRAVTRAVPLDDLERVFLKLQLVATGRWILFAAYRLVACRPVGSSVESAVACKYSIHREVPSISLSLNKQRFAYSPVTQQTPTGLFHATV